jgi:hypothetical protein
MVPGVQIPDFAGTLLRGQQMQQQGELSRLQMLAAQRQMEQDQLFEGAASQIIPQLGNADNPTRLALLAKLGGAGVRGAQLALPMLEAERERALTNAIVARVFPGMGLPGSDAPSGAPTAPAVRPSVPQVGTAALPPAAPRGEAPVPVAQGIAARAALDPNAPDYPERIMAINNAVVGATMPGQRMPQGGARVVPASATAQPPATPAGGQGGLPTPQQLFALMMSGNRGAQELGARLAPLVARDNPNWVTATADGQVFMVNPQNPTQRIPLGSAAGTTPDWVEQTVLNLGPLVAAGRATPAQQQEYSVAATAWQSRGQQMATIPDPNNPGQTLQAAIPRPLPPNFPAPPPLVVGPQAAPQQPGQAPAQAAAPPAPAVQPAQPNGVPIGTTGLTASPPDPNAPRVISVTPGSPQAREAARTAEVGAGRVLDAINSFRVALEPFRGATGFAAFNPRSIEGQNLQSAYELLKMAMRDESLLNTGVLQPGENVMIENMLRSPTSVSGIFASIDGYNTMLDQFAGFVERGTNRVRESARLPPIDWTQPRPGVTPRPGGAGNNRPDPLGLLRNRQ